MKTLFLSFIILLFISGCSSKTALVLEQENNKKVQTLYKQYKKWDKTPYKYAGTTLKGIDCSSLMQHIYKSAFNIQLPRTTSEQADIGFKIHKNNLKAGDLILFKTGFSSMHSGIYLEKGKFIHSSTQVGVTISSLKNIYWRDYYYQSRRVIE